MGCNQTKPVISNATYFRATAGPDLRAEYEERVRRKYNPDAKPRRDLESVGLHIGKSTKRDKHGRQRNAFVYIRPQNERRGDGERLGGGVSGGGGGGNGGEAVYPPDERVSVLGGSRRQSPASPSAGGGEREAPRGSDAGASSAASSPRQHHGTQYRDPERPLAPMPRFGNSRGGQAAGRQGRGRGGGVGGSFVGGGSRRQGRGRAEGSVASSSTGKSQLWLMMQGC